MDFIKGTEQVKIDPNGIEISGTNNILLKSDGKVGIGTNNPQYPLQVNGSHAIFSNTPELLLFKEYGPGRLGPTLDWGNTTYTDWKIKAEESGLKITSGANGNTYESISISNTGTIDISGDMTINGDFEISGNKFVVTDTGNVGIGTTTPASKLDVNGKISTQDSLEIGPINDMYKGLTVTKDDVKMVIGNYGGGYNLPSIQVFSNLASNETPISSSNTYHMLIQPNGGNVGIGSIAADAKLHIHEDQTDTYIQKWSYGEGRALELMTPNTVADPFIFSTGNSIEFKIDTASAFKINDDRAIGIGTNNPNKAKLHIDGNIYHTINARYYNHVGGQGTGTVNRPLSIWTSDHIACSELQVYSDKRIKTDISLVDDDTALNRVNALESYEYNYIDPIRRRPMKTIGFIAQEVKEVVPNAVSLQPDFVPDEMRIITEPAWSQDASNNWLLEIPQLDMSGAFTGKAKFYVSNDPSGNDEVCKEVEIESDKKTFVFDQSWNNVFFYGKEVSDFHSIEKSQIFALHHSAIQELSRRNDEKTEKIKDLEQQVTSLSSRLEAVESILLSLQNN